MHPTTVFTAPFGFVGWTIPSPHRLGCLPSSLYTFLTTEAWLGITLSHDLGFPEFGRYHLTVTRQAALGNRTYRVTIQP
jgi:hypothetical protein